MSGNEISGMGWIGEIRAQHQPPPIQPVETITLYGLRLGHPVDQPIIDSATGWCLDRASRRGRAERGRVSGDVSIDFHFENAKDAVEFSLLFP